MTDQDKARINREIALFLGWTYSACGCCGIDGSFHWHEPISMSQCGCAQEHGVSCKPPDFYRREKLSAMLLERMPEAQLWVESSKDETRLWGCQPDIMVDDSCAFDPDRKTAVALAFVEFMKAGGKQ